MKEKLHKIGDVAQKLNLKSYVLRYWETEFPQLHPKRTPKGQRLYSEKTIELLSKIQYLLHEQGLTIEGARKILSGDSELTALKNAELTNPAMNNTVKKQHVEKNTLDKLLSSVQKELFSLKDLLQTYPKPKT